MTAFTVNTTTASTMMMSLRLGITRRGFMLAAMLCAMALGVLLSSVTTAKAGQEMIAAVVNDDVITFSDVNDRMTLIIRSSGMPDTDEMRERLAPQILGALIEEQLMLQEGHRNDIEVTEEDIEAGFAQIAAQNGVSGEEFRMMIEGSGVNVGTMLRQIESQIAWGKSVQQVIRPRITVTDADVDDAFSRLRSRIGRTEYLLAMILIPVEDPREANNIRDMSYQMARDIQAQAVPFSRIAQQFSKAAGADQGGDIGWVQDDQLDPKILAVVASMQERQVSDPIQTQNGYHIVMMRDKRTISEENFPSSEEMLNVIGTERLERMQRRHMQDLRSSAFIETRV
ncbi:MAG: peptidylprolyl isomerase [Alphaproteobacteria bacterium]